MFESAKLLMLCVTSALFIAWIMALKVEIITLMDEARSLKGVPRKNVSHDPRGTRFQPGSSPWGGRAF